jgi:hypothetical protein
MLMLVLLAILTACAGARGQQILVQYGFISITGSAGGAFRNNILTQMPEVCTKRLTKIDLA